MTKMTKNRNRRRIKLRTLKRKNKRRVGKQNYRKSRRSKTLKKLKGGK